MTGNAVPEVLVELTFFEPLQYSEGALFVHRCAGGEFAGGAVLMTAGQVLSADEPDGIRAVRDMYQDGVPEIVTAPGPGGGPHIKVFSGLGYGTISGPLGSFFAYDPAFAGGIFVSGSPP